MDPGHALLDLLERYRSAAIARDADRLTALYAEHAVHEFPFGTPGAPTRIEGRAAIAEFQAAAFRGLPFAYSEYRTIAVHEVNASTLVVEQVAIGSNTTTGAPIALPNIAVLEVDRHGLIVSFRDYVNPLAVTEALGDVAPAFGDA